MALTFDIDTSGIDRKLRAAEVATRSAALKAGGDAIRSVQVESKSRIRQKKRIKVADLGKALPLIFPSNKQANLLIWKMGVPYKPMPLAAFPVRQVKAGVSVEVNVGRRVIVKGAFLAKMRSGHEGVFRRKGKGRLPIKEAFTTTIRDTFSDAGMVPAVMNRGAEVFASSFRRLLPLELKAAGAA